MRMKVIGLVVTAGLCSVAFGDIFATNGSVGFNSITNSEDFESYADFAFPGDPFDSPGGMHFQSEFNNDLVIWGAGGGVGFPTRCLYQNGGGNAMLSISLTSGGDIVNQIELDVANGFGPADPHNVWVRAYNNGAPVADFDFNGIAASSTISVWATGGSVFDELRVQSYGSNANNHNEADFGAVSIDNVKMGIGVPAPGTFALLGLSGLVATRRRR